MLLTFLVIFGVFMILLVALPMINGIATIKVGSKNNKPKPTSKRERLKQKMYKEDFPVNVKLSGRSDDKFGPANKFGLKQRVVGKAADAMNKDPNVFDFDIDELINEDRAEEQRLQQKKWESIKNKQQWEEDMA